VTDELNDFHGEIRTYLDALCAHVAELSRLPRDSPSEFHALAALFAIVKILAWRVQELEKAVPQNRRTGGG
jgi:hypothetical protein